MNKIKYCFYSYDDIDLGSELSKRETLSIWKDGKESDAINFEGDELKEVIEYVKNIKLSEEQDRYIIIVKENIDEFVFVGSNRTRVINYNKARTFSIDSIIEFEIETAETFEEFGEFLCGSPNTESFAIRKSLFEEINSNPTLVYYRNNLNKFNQTGGN